jgi:nucleotide-binding universal stress UspA family protein
MEEKMLPEIKKILYATDLSKNSSYAFLYAVDLARRYSAQIIILHAIAPIPPAVFYESGLGGEKTGEIIKERERKDQMEQIKKSLQTFCVKVEGQVGPPCAGLVSDTLVPKGHPVEEIVNAAEEQKCDFIVLGTHAKGFLKQTFLGSVARSVLERTRKPVFIIPLPSEKAPGQWEEI